MLNIRNQKLKIELSDQIEVPDVIFVRSNLAPADKSRFIQLIEPYGVVKEVGHPCRTCTKQLDLYSCAISSQTSPLTFG